MSLSQSYNDISAEKRGALFRQLDGLRNDIKVYVDDMVRGSDVPAKDLTISTMLLGSKIAGGTPRLHISLDRRDTPKAAKKGEEDRKLLMVVMVALSLDRNFALYEYEDDCTNKKLLGCGDADSLFPAIRAQIHHAYKGIKDEVLLNTYMRSLTKNRKIDLEALGKLPGVPEPVVP